MEIQSKPRLIYILPKNHKDMDTISLVKSLNEFFDAIIVTDDIRYEKLKKKKKILYIGNIEGETQEKCLLPYSVIASDRHLLDYSNMGSIEKKIDQKTYIKNYKKIINLIDNFKPDLLVTQICDNSLSVLACFAAEKKGIFFCSEFVRPYLEDRQILINSRTFDNKQIKNIADLKFKELPKDAEIKSHKLTKYNTNSDYWMAGVNRKGLFNLKKFKALYFYTKLYGVNVLFRFIFSYLMERRFKNALPKGNFILMPLHLQPEAVFLGTDNRNSDQAALVNYISFNLPINYKLLVKEHWAQKVRPIGFYQKIFKLINVMPLSKSYDILAAIEASEIVALISGNAGFEALRQGKKVILFGQTFYDGCPNCFRFQGQEPLYSFFERVLKAELVEQRIVDNYIACLEMAAIENSIEISVDSLGTGDGACGAGDRLINLFLLYKNNEENYGDLI